MLDGMTGAGMKDRFPIGLFHADVKGRYDSCPDAILTTDVDTAERS
jgi:hypothetical protein